MTRDEKIDLLRDCVRWYTISPSTEKQLLDFIDELTAPKCKPCPRYEPLYTPWNEE